MNKYKAPVAQNVSFEIFDFILVSTDDETQSCPNYVPGGCRDYDPTDDIYI